MHDSEGAEISIIDLTERQRRVAMEGEHLLQRSVEARDIGWAQGIPWSPYMLASADLIAKDCQQRLGQKGADGFWRRLNEHLQDGGFDRAHRLYVFDERALRLKSETRATLVEIFGEADFERSYLRKAYMPALSWQRWCLENHIPLPPAFEKFAGRRDMRRPLSALHPATATWAQAIDILSRKQIEGTKVDTKNAHLLILEEGLYISQNEAEKAATAVTKRMRGRPRKGPN